MLGVELPLLIRLFDDTDSLAALHAHAEGLLRLPDQSR